MTDDERIRKRAREIGERVRGDETWRDHLLTRAMNSTPEACMRWCLERVESDLLALARAELTREAEAAPVASEEHEAEVARLRAFAAECWRRYYCVANLMQSNAVAFRAANGERPILSPLLIQEARRCEDFSCKHETLINDLLGAASAAESEE